MLKSICSVVALYMLCIVSPAQQVADVLDSFSLIRLGNAVQLSIVIRGGASCNGIVLERSGGDVQFSTIDVIPGICGGTDRPELYSFTDKSPFPNTLNHYRILLGETGYSDTLSVFYVPVKNDFILYPNPAEDSFHVVFDQPHQWVQLRMYTLHGAVCREWHLYNSSEFVAFPELEVGLYYLCATTAQGEIKTQKIIIKNIE